MARGITCVLHPSFVAPRSGFLCAGATSQPRSRVLACTKRASIAFCCAASTSAKSRSCASIVLGGFARSTEHEDGLGGDNACADGDDDTRGIGEFWEGGCIWPPEKSTLDAASSEGERTCDSVPVCCECQSSRSRASTSEVAGQIFKDPCAHADFTQSPSREWVSAHNVNHLLRRQTGSLLRTP